MAQEYLLIRLFQSDITWVFLLLLSRTLAQIAMSLNVPEFDKSVPIKEKKI